MTISIFCALDSRDYIPSPPFESKDQAQESKDHCSYHPLESKDHCPSCPIESKDHIPYWPLESKDHFPSRPLESRDHFRFQGDVIIESSSECALRIACLQSTSGAELGRRRHHRCRRPRLRLHHLNHHHRVPPERRILEAIIHRDFHRFDYPFIVDFDIC